MAISPLSRLQVVSLAEYAAWFEEHCTALQNRSPFHHPAWLEAVEKSLSAKTVLIGYYRAKRLWAVLPGLLATRGPARFFGSPLRGTNTSYLGPVTLPMDGPADIVEMLKACQSFVRKQLGVQYVEFTLPRCPRCPCEPSESVHAPRAVGDIGAGWEPRRVGTYWLDLSGGQEALWAGFSYSARRHIRKSERLGLRIVPFRDPHLYYTMLDETFGRRGTVDWHPERFFSTLMDDLIPRGLLWSWGVEHEHKIIAAGLFLHDDTEMHFLSGASLSEFRSIPTSYLLHWHAIKEAAQAGVRLYDLNGNGVPSINQFKESFSPDTVEYWSQSWAPAYFRYASHTLLTVLPYLGRLRRSYRDFSRHESSKA